MNMTDFSGGSRWGNYSEWALSSSVGIGRQMWCGHENVGATCAGGNRALRRNGSCTAQSLFGDDDWYACRNGAPDGSGCEHVVAEASGPTEGDVWCLTAPFVNDGAHVCKHDPKRYCHVLTLRAGRGTGVALRVDEHAPDISTHKSTQPRHTARTRVHASKCARLPHCCTPLRLWTLHAPRVLRDVLTTLAPLHARVRASSGRADAPSSGGLLRWRCAVGRPRARRAHRHVQL
jgi:hypothetical protein